MTYKDTMTPIERSIAMKNNQLVDRWPISLLHGTVSSKYIKMSYLEANSTAKNIADKEIEFYRKTGLDGVSVKYGLHGLGNALGSELNQLDYSYPSVTNFVIDSLDQISELNSDLTKLSNDKNLIKNCEASEIIHKSIGDEVGCSIGLTAPYTSSASIIEPSELLTETRKNPEKVHKLLRFSTDCFLNLLDELNENFSYLNYSISDPLASGQIIGPKMYKEFALPYTKELVDKIHGFGKKVTLHICGDTTNILNLMVDTGIDTLSLDNAVSLLKAKNTVGEKVTLLGNIDPMEYFLSGNEATIKKEIEKCFMETYDNPKGYICGSGCDIPYDAPLENIDYFVKWSKYYASNNM